MMISFKLCLHPQPIPFILQVKKKEHSYIPSLLQKTSFLSANLRQICVMDLCAFESFKNLIIQSTGGGNSPVNTQFSSEEALPGRGSLCVPYTVKEQLSIFAQ